YLIHAVEEFFGGAGLPLTPHRMRGFNLTPMQFIVINCAAWLLLVVGLALARRRGFPHLLLLILGTIFLVNGLLHVLTALRTAAYTPGLITSPLVFIPLGALTLYRLRGDMPLRRYGMGVALGAGIHLLISLLAHNGRSLFGS
ncbi:MAG TPA: HXXEE domain-containing protein, partial [Pyrinomonadaceae bacterium]|nr:HXXEE domain-containing protein [Pyrinomonadaceae bacterium]